MDVKNYRPILRLSRGNVHNNRTVTVQTYSTILLVSFTIWVIVEVPSNR